MSVIELRQQVELACRHLLSEQDRDPHMPTYGCFDRRYWGWKLVDYPEATFQRNVYPLAWLLRERFETPQADGVEVLVEAVLAGLRFAVRIQHRNGSFDQAFPYEHSFGATAFLLHPLLQAYLIVQKEVVSSEQEAVETCLRRAADFLCGHEETHGHIANHLAGAVLSLLVSAKFFAEPRYERRALALLERLLAQQSSEGWFLEYEGADPGYQTLCLYYLAQVYHLRPDSTLRAALERAVTFLSWFVHPDGTFGGEYGSRRTAIFYPGGLALLSQEFPVAARITRFMLQAITERQTVTLGDVDMGNLAPLLTNYVMVLDTALPEQARSEMPLPWERDEVRQDFIEAGLFIRGRRRYYAIVGASNGGVLKVFDRQQRLLIWNDGGYVGQLDTGAYITTQMTHRACLCQASADEVTVQAPFFYMLRAVSTPLQFVVLRLLNLTIMRSVVLGNGIKKLLVRLLISKRQKVPLSLSRSIRFASEQVVIADELRLTRQLGLRWLEFGRPFVAIHMASARYFEGFRPHAVSRRQACHIDVKELRSRGKLRQQVSI